MTWQVQDLVRTPLGLLGTVLGVKYDEPSSPDTGRLWVRYDNGHEAPLEPRAGAAAGSVSQLGAPSAQVAGGRALLAAQAGQRVCARTHACTPSRCMHHHRTWDQTAQHRL